MGYIKIIRKIQQKTRRLGAKDELGIIGLDLSLRGTGLAVLVDGQLISLTSWTDHKGLQQQYPHILSWYKMQRNTESNRQHRLCFMTDIICETIDALCLRCSKVLVALEGYAFSKLSSGSSDMHELGGIVKRHLWDKQIRFRIYDPLSIKLAWTNSGIAEKDKMVLVAAKKFPNFAEDLKGIMYKNLDAAGNLADASLIAGLLELEYKLKSGIVDLRILEGGLRRVMIRTTKSLPEALISRNFIHIDEATVKEPSLAGGRLLHVEHVK
jgi:Holliday junction resolvasome RuvABC endonuclease subunit